MSKQDRDDWEAFKQRYRDIVPLDNDGRHHHPKKLPKPKPLFLTFDEGEEVIRWVDQPDLASMTHYLKEGHSPRLLKDLRRGRFRCNSELDLHGFNRETARIMLHQFLEEALSYREECVCIIVGKGLRSSTGPILRSFVKAWLMQNDRVIAFTEAPVGQGGSGAIFVLLKIHAKSPKK